MHWNHRIIQLNTPDPDEVIYTIAEVFYEEDGSLMAWGEVSLVLDHPEEVLELTDRMRKAQEQPVIHENEFGAAHAQPQ